MPGTATTFPAAAATFHLDYIGFRVDNCLLYGIADLYIFPLAESDITIPVTNNDDSTELDTPSRVGHPLDHLDIENFIFEIGQECIDDLRLFDGPPAIEHLVDAGDLTGSDLFPKTRQRNPFYFFVRHVIPAPS
jgi:hypothetical protein